MLNLQTSDNQAFAKFRVQNLGFSIQHLIFWRAASRKKGRRTRDEDFYAMPSSIKRAKPAA